MSIVINFIPVALYIAAPIMIAAIGGMICERAGIVNIGLEGLMGVGAFVAASIQYVLYPALGEGTWIISCILSMICGGIFSLILAYATINWNANQTIIGIGMNLLAIGITVSLSQTFFKSETTPNFKNGMTKGLFDLYPSVYISLIVVILAFILINYTIFGLRLRSSGEFPQATNAAGISVVKIRYTAVIISGILAGLAGACLVLTVTVRYSNTTISGQGFIALSAVSFGKWKAQGVLGASLLFGAAVGLAVYSSNIAVLSAIPSEVFSMFPYILTLLVLVLFSQRNRPPKSLGVNFSITGR